MLSRNPLNDLLEFTLQSNLDQFHVELFITDYSQKKSLTNFTWFSNLNFFRFKGTFHSFTSIRFCWFLFLMNETILILLQIIKNKQLRDCVQTIHMLSFNTKFKKKKWIKKISFSLFQKCFQTHGICFKSFVMDLNLVWHNIFLFQFKWKIVRISFGYSHKRVRFCKIQIKIHKTDEYLSTIFMFQSHRIQVHCEYKLTRKPFCLLNKNHTLVF